MPVISCSAPGKVILCGEHAVVYAAPAIALPVFKVSTVTKILARPMAIQGEVQIVAPAIGMDDALSTISKDHPLRITLDLVMTEFHIDHIPACQIMIHSTLPMAAGLGSSASTSVSLIRASSAFLGHPLPHKTVNQLAFEVEKLQHGTPSGIDNTVITYESPIFYQRGMEVEFIKIKCPFTLVIADTGIKSSTAEAVNGVRQRRLASPRSFERMFSEIGEISIKAKACLEHGNIDALGQLLFRNHELLSDMGVSCDELNNLVDVALHAGAMGAKLSGGGLGGNIIALVDEKDAVTVSKSLLAQGAVRTIITTIPAIESQGGIK